MRNPNCEICGRPGEKHHRVYRSQGGLDFKLNYKYLCCEHHKGSKGPHQNRATDLRYKLEMQDNLIKTLIQEHYTVEELAKALEMQKSEAKKAVKTLPLTDHGYKTVDIIKRLMGGRFYIGVKEVSANDTCN